LSWLKSPAGSRGHDGRDDEDPLVTGTRQRCIAAVGLAAGEAAGGIVEETVFGCRVTVGRCFPPVSGAPAWGSRAAPASRGAGDHSARLARDWLRATKPPEDDGGAG
jgi:hypothetical protein